MISPPVQILLLLIALTADGSTHALTLSGSYCTNTTTSSPKYRSNINSLLSALSSAAATSAFRFSSAGANSSTAVYGLYLCRGDQTPSSCSACVAVASEFLNASCPTSSAAFVSYAECLIKFSNDSSFTQLPNDDIVADYPVYQNVTNDLNLFNQVLNSTLRKVVDEAAAGGAQLKYATATADYQDAGPSTLYSLAQCTPNLSARDCRRCLQATIQYLSDNHPGAQGGWVVAYSCALQYETYLFYDRTLSLAPPPSPHNSHLLPTQPIKSPGNKSSSKVVIGVVTGATAAGLICVASVICLIKGKKKKKKMKNRMFEAPVDKESVVSDDLDTSESLLYEFDTLQAATNNFADDRKIGQGGFGSVYKGLLPDGKEIAVKRLSTRSSQVIREIRNEVILVAKLQHRNLVRLLGFCLAADEKLLVFEYAANKSLNTFLFDPEKKQLLDWPIRYKIISGIARGMLYLHEDSQLKIIHRDLKASNVLLDADMKAKISDFGIARIFNRDQTQGNTSNVVGTYGYMAPEYALHGKFSAKSDVYSFGVLVLEIVSGRRASNFHNESDNAESFLSYAWKLWSEGTPLEFVDQTLTNSCSNNEVIRCIHLGLLCVQDDTMKRPSMARIMLMLESDSVIIPAPQKPGLFIRRRARTEALTDKSSSKSISSSVNEVTMTEFDPR